MDNLPNQVQAPIKPEVVFANKSFLQTTLGRICIILGTIIMIRKLPLDPKNPCKVWDNPQRESTPFQPLDELTIK